MRRSVLAEIDNSVITKSTRSAVNLTMQSVDWYALFKKGNPLDSTDRNKLLSYIQDVQDSFYPPGSPPPTVGASFPHL